MLLYGHGQTAALQPIFAALGPFCHLEKQLLRPNLGLNLLSKAQSLNYSLKFGPPTKKSDHPWHITTIKFGLIFNFNNIPLFLINDNVRLFIVHIIKCIL